MKPGLYAKRPFPWADIYFIYIRLFAVDIVYSVRICFLLCWYLQAITWWSTNRVCCVLCDSVCVECMCICVNTIWDVSVHMCAFVCTCVNKPVFISIRVVVPYPRYITFPFADVSYVH